MSDSTLVVTRSEIRDAVSFQLGYGALYSSITDETKQAVIKSVIREGLRNCYSAHPWRFLRPTGEISTVANQWEYQLPATFSELIGPVVNTTSQGYPQIARMGVADILAARSSSDATGAPRCGAIRMETPTGDKSQRFTLIVHPTPDAVYTLGFRYVLSVAGLSDESEFLPGGAEYGQMVMASCRASAELRVNGAYGQHYADYMNEVTKAIKLESVQQGPDSLGYNGDGNRLDKLDFYARRWAVAPTTNY